MDRAVAKDSALDQTKSDAGKTETDMSAARKGDTAAVRNDLHQRFPRHGQLLYAQRIRRGPEMPPQEILCELARRQVGDHEVPISQFTPSNRLLIR
jgi:hypothetical protein